MSKIKSLILGSAAGFVAIAGAQAADLPVKAKAVQYVKICSLYGAGFYYIPGTDTCIKIGGYVQFDVNLNSNTYNAPFIAAGVTAAGVATGGGYGSRDRDFFNTRQRTQFTVDTRTATEYGVVRSYWDVKFQFTSNTDAVAQGSLEVDYGFVQFAGFTFGKSVSAYSTPWQSANGNNNTSALLGGHDNATGVANINYTWQFGNGVSAQLGVAEAKTTAAGNNYYRGILINASAATGAAASGQVASGAYANAYAGNGSPDIQGNIRVDQAAFTAQLSAAAHQIRGGYYNGTANGFVATGVETNGHPEDTWGFAIAGGLQLKNLPTGPGDKLTIDAGYAEGAVKYIFSGTFGNSYGITGSPDNALSYQSLAVGTVSDGVFTTGSGIEKTKAYGVRAGFIHNWNQYWESDLFGSYSKLEYGAASAAALCGLYNVGGRTTSNGFTCNPDISVWQIGSRLGWTPVQNLTFSAEVMYTGLEQNNTGSVTGLAITSKPTTAIYDFKDQGTLSGNLRVRRTF